MRQWLRSHLTYANVMATLGVFLVLGGGAYAASKIGADDIKRNAVRSKHIKNGQVKKRDLGKSSLDALRASCPSGMKLVGKGRDLCVDRVDRATNKNWTDALNACASAGLRLPSVAEALEARGVLNAGGGEYWTDAIYDDSGVGSFGLTYVANTGIGREARVTTLSVRCVATPSDA